MAQLCYGCMKTNNGEQICPVCGFDRNTVQTAPFLPLGTTLQDGNYIVGRKLRNNAEGAKYIGYSKNMESAVIISEFMPAGICGRAKGKTKVVVRTGFEEQYKKLNDEFLTYYRNIARLRELTSIAPIFDIFTENGVSYTVSEYYESIPFTEYIERRNGSIDWNTARPLFMPLIATLSSLHAAGIGHYAISPDNLEVISSGKLRLTDFAIKDIRQTGTVFRAELMDGCAAPEQYKEIGVLDEATDVYGLTATLFYALTGRLPENSNERKPDGKLSIPTSVFKRLPPHIVSALAGGLQVQKLNRIESFEEMRNQLSSAPTVKAIQNEANRSAIQTEVADNYSPKKKDGVPGYIFAILTVLVCLLILIGVGIWWVSANPDGFNSVFNPAEQSQDEDSQSSEDTGDTPRIPDLVGKRYDDIVARQDANSDYIVVPAVEQVFTDRYEEGIIVSQSPAKDTPARKGSEKTYVVVTVSMGPQERELPVISGQSVETAVKQLNAQGFIASGIYVSSNKVEAGKVIGYANFNAGDKEKYGSTIVIQISTGIE